MTATITPTRVDPKPSVANILRVSSREGGAAIKFCVPLDGEARQQPGTG